MAGRPSLRRSLAVWTNGHRVARWSIAASGSHALAYERDWIEAAHGRPLSLSLPFPLRGRSLSGARVASFFDHLL
ncbi:MAG TPA: HipA N-terminal domain-containing protein, partial [Polyangiales bacterium]